LIVCLLLLILPGLGGGLALGAPRELPDGLGAPALLDLVPDERRVRLTLGQELADLLLDGLRVGPDLEGLLLEDEELEIANTAVLILENAVELTEPPIPEAKAHNEYYRTIGVGFMGLADWLASNNKNYYTGKDLAKSMFERYAKYCIQSSVELAKKL
jgi:hypothetical protein